MSIKKYEMFLKIIDAGSVSKAAEILGCTQSGITHGLKSLEEELGITLLIRNKSGVKLTEEGKQLFPMIKEVVNMNNHLLQSVSEMKKPVNHIIRIGTFKSMAVSWLPKIIKEYQQENPKVSFKLIDGDYDDIDKWIADKEIDICFINMDMKPECRTVKLCDDRLLAVLPVTHPMANEKYFPVEEFEKEPVISLIDNTDQDARNVLSRAGIVPDSRLKTKDEFAMLAMVENGLGICIMPELMLAGWNGSIAARELYPPAKRTIGLAIPDKNDAGRETDRFANFIVDWVKKNYRGII